jgi:exopolysaccharide biosynthesis polyprenyl glycosylphosphotransferase
MRERDTSDVLASAVAVGADAAAVFGGFALGTWVRFSSGWLSVPRGQPENLYTLYLIGAAFATLVLLLVFHALGLFIRPQTGSFISKIPRLTRGVLAGALLTVVLAYAVKNEADFSRLTIGMGVGLSLVFVLLERYILFRVEWNLARHSPRRNRVLVLGTDAVAAHLWRTLKREAMLRSRVIGFLRTDELKPDPEIAPEDIKGGVEQLAAFVGANEVDQIVLTNSRPGAERMMEILLLCERNLITFNMVPDLFHLMTASMDVQTLDDIPLLGLARWPLDHFWNRLLKRLEDVVGAVVGLFLAAPVLAAAAVLIKLDSPGPILYRQARCGEQGRVFTLYKLRTMGVDAERESGPVFAAEQDARRTRVGALLRRHSLDELPQLWNVLRGEMSLVGPRPERPHFVEKFKTDVGRYMWRHVSKPGITGWAQVNGLRGDTSIAERIKYDLYYLENWSLAFDFKIMARTLLAHETKY